MALNYNTFPSAERDIIQALDWYSEKGGKKLVIRFLRAYIKARTNACENPYTQAPIIEDFRKIRLAKFPYGIVYKVHNDEVYIIAVAHDKRHPDYWHSRI